MTKNFKFKSNFFEIKLNDGSNTDLVFQNVVFICFEGNSEVEFGEYVFLFRKYEQQMTRAFNDLKYAFEIMDGDGNGYVTIDELK